MWQFRVFLSHSHEDTELVGRVAEVLRQRGLLPMWDRNIRPGTPFTDAIKGLIVHAHIFMPVLTEHARQRPWVHQETGYAMALHIPVLPLAVGDLPGEMIAQLQAVSVKPDLSDLEQRLDEVNIEHVVFAPPTEALPVVEVADWPEKRAELLTRYAHRVIELGYHGRVRARGGLSTFCLPDRDTDDPIWRARDGANPRSDYHNHLFLEQRRVMERHAREAGCDLIVDPTIELQEVDAAARTVRLTTLLEFLASMPDDRLRVACSPRARDAHVTIVGDWFIAESRLRSPGQGWRQTVFSWHAPTVLRGVQQFDQLFGTLLAKSGPASGSSRKTAMAAVEKVIADLACGGSNGGKEEHAE